MPASLAAPAEPSLAPRVRPAATWAAVYLGAAAVAFVSVMPMLVGVLAQDLGLGAERAGVLAATDRAGALAGTVVCVLALRRQSRRRIAAAGMLALTVGNAVTGFFTAWGPLLVCRFAVGFAQGTVSAICYAAMGGCPRPARAFAFYCALQMILGSLGAWIIPWLLEVGGWPAPFHALALLALPGIGVAALIPGSLPKRSPERGGAKAPNSSRAWIALASIFVFFVGAGGLYAFLERIGDAAGLTRAVIARSLSMASLAGLAGSLLAGGVAHRWGAGRGAALGGALSLAAMAAFLLPANGVLFPVAAAGFNFSWNLLYPFQFAGLAQADRRGSATAFTPAATGSGFALGPALAAVLFEHHGSGAVSMVALGLGMMSLALLFGAARSK